MSNNRFEIQGLDELRAALRALPASLANEARLIVERAAESSHNAVIVAYPNRSGRLDAGVSMRLEASSQFGVMARVRSGARHAHIYEYGRSKRGGQAAQPTFYRIIEQDQRQMIAQLAALVARAGLAVQGTADDRG